VTAAGLTPTKSLQGGHLNTLHLMAKGLLVALLAFPEMLPPWVLVPALVVGALWFAGQMYGYRGRGWAKLSLVLLLPLVMSIVVAPLRWIAMERFSTVLAGMLTFSWIAIEVRRRERWNQVALGFLWAGSAALFSGWLVTLSGRYFVNPNAIGGSVIYFLPLSVATALNSGFRKAIRGMGFGVALSLMLLLLWSGSRTAAFSAVLPLMLVFHSSHRTRQMNRLVRAGSTITIIAVAWATLILHPWGLGDATWPMYRTLQSRFELWSRGVEMLRDMPLTGIGLNGFRWSVSTYFPPTIMRLDGVAHAHNFLLQTALDLGIPGCMVFLAWMESVRRCGVKARLSRTGDCASLVGIEAGVLGTLLFGVTDAIALGSKVMLIAWAFAGLLVSASAEETSDVSKIIG